MSQLKTISGLLTQDKPSVVSWSELKTRLVGYFNRARKAKVSDPENYVKRATSI